MNIPIEEVAEPLFQTVKRNVIDDDHTHVFHFVCFSADGEHAYLRCECGAEDVE